MFRATLEGEKENDELKLAIDKIRDDFDENLLADVLTGLDALNTEKGAPEAAPGEPETSTELVDEGPAPGPVDEITPDNEPADIMISADEPAPAEPSAESPAETV